jgi:hypothetical protein
VNCTEIINFGFRVNRGSQPARNDNPT